MATQIHYAKKMAITIVATALLGLAATAQWPRSIRRSIRLLITTFGLFESAQFRRRQAT